MPFSKIAGLPNVESALSKMSALSSLSLDYSRLEYIHRESSQKSTRIAPPSVRGRSSPTPPAHETSMPPSPPKPTSRRPRGSPRETSIIVVVVALATASNAVPAPLCARCSFSSPCSSTGARCIHTASQRMSDRTMPLRIRVASLLRSLENKPAGSQRVDTVTLLLVAQRSSRQCSSTAACSLIKRTQSRS